MKNSTTTSRTSGGRLRSPRLPPRRSTWTRGAGQAQAREMVRRHPIGRGRRRRDLGAARFAAVPVTIGVGHDAQQPRAACSIVAQLNRRKSLKCLNIGIVHEILSVGGLRTQATRSPMKRGEEWSRLPLEFLAQPPIAQHKFRGHRSLPCTETPQCRHTSCANSFTVTYFPLTAIWPRISTWTVQGELVCPGRHILRNPHRV